MEEDKLKDIQNCINNSLRHVKGLIKSLPVLAKELEQLREELKALEDA